MIDTLIFDKITRYARNIFLGQVRRTDSRASFA